MNEGSLIVDVPDEVERVVRAPADHPHARSQLEALLETQIRNQINRPRVD